MNKIFCHTVILFLLIRKQYFPWDKIIQDQNILMSNIDKISDDIYFMTSSIEHEQLDKNDNLEHIKKFKSWEEWCNFAEHIEYTSSNRVAKFESYKTCEQIEDDYKFPFDALTTLLNFWNAMLYIHYEDALFCEKIKSIIEMYKKYNNFIGDEDCYQKLTKQVDYDAEVKKKKN